MSVSQSGQIEEHKTEISHAKKEGAEKSVIGGESKPRQRPY